MFFSNIKIKNLRIISEIELNPSTGINIIEGVNGAGKTSILEALYLLARNRSFKSSSIKHIIKTDQKIINISAKINHSNGYIAHISLSKSSNLSRFTINGQQQNSLAAIAKSLPIGIITPEIHRIIDEGPNHRRRLLDWGVFHVEHNYQLLMSNYRKVLLQRNKALQQNINSISIWDKQLTSLSKDITVKRSAYLGQLTGILNLYLKSFFKSEDFDVDYYKGWNDKYTLEDCLLKSLPIDKKRGFTTLGPHRADIKIKYKSKPAHDILSRGQQKILASLLILSNMTCLKKTTNQSGILLFDDINSELDSNNLSTIIDLIYDSNHQAFLTTINRLNVDFSGKDIEMFHVEHGKII